MFVTSFVSAFISSLYSTVAFNFTCSSSALLPRCMVLNSSSFFIIWFVFMFPISIINIFFCSVIFSSNSTPCAFCSSTHFEYSSICCFICSACCFHIAIASSLLISDLSQFMLSQSGSSGISNFCNGIIVLIL